MPYFIYRIHRYGGLERLEDLPTFAAASQRAKSLRADPGHDAGISRATAPAAVTGTT